MWIGRYEALGLLFDLVLDGDLWILVVILVHLQGGIGHHSRRWVPGSFLGDLWGCQRTGPQWQAIWVPWKDYWNRKPQWLFCKEPLPYCTVALICIFPNNIEHLFSCLFAILISLDKLSVQNGCPFFLMDSCFHIIELQAFFICSKSQSFIKWILNKYFLPVLIYLFILI